MKGDFVLTATTPLSVVPGDEFTATVTVANQLEGDAITDQVTVRAETEGGVEIIDAAPEKQTVAVGKEITLRYRCRVLQQLGNAELKFTAASGNSQQVARSSFSVRPGVARAAKVQSGWFRNGSHDVAVKHPMFQEFSERQAIISTTPLGLAHGLSAYLKEYPHGCTEQITSRAFPWLVLKDDANFGIEKEQAAKAIADTMNQLANRQGRNGGFGYWSTDEQEGFDYLTVYVGQFLTECKSSGLHVPARLYQSTLRRLRYMADAKVTDPYTHNGRTYYWRTRWEAEMRAAAIYLLTRNEEVTTNYALKLQDYLDDKVPKAMWHRDSTAAWLAATWRLLKKESAAKPLIQAHRAALKKPVPGNWEYGYYYYTSNLTREATAFTILCRHFPELAKKLTYEEMKPLTEMIEQADFHTLSAAWSVQALKAYSDLAASNGVKAGIASVQGQDVKVLAEPATGQLRIQVPEGMTRFFFAGNSPEGLGAWYQTIETGFAKDLPEKASSMHIEVLRELVDAAGEPVTQSKLGDTLFAKLTVRNLTKTDLPNHRPNGNVARWFRVRAAWRTGFAAPRPRDPPGHRLHRRPRGPRADLSRLAPRGSRSRCNTPCARPAPEPSWSRHRMPRTCMRRRCGRTEPSAKSSSCRASRRIRFHGREHVKVETVLHPLVQAVGNSVNDAGARLLRCCRNPTCCRRTWNTPAWCWIAMAMSFS